MLQQRFIDEYMLDLAPAAAAIRAGYPPQNAKAIGVRLLKHPPVRDAIAKRVAARSARMGVNQERIIQQLGIWAFGDLRTVFHAGGGLRDIAEMSHEDASQIAGIKTRRTVTMGDDGKMAPEVITEIKTVDRLSAAKLLMQHLGMLDTHIEMTVNHNVADRLKHAYARVGRSRPADTPETESLEANAGALLEHEEFAQPDLATWEHILG